MAGPARPAPLKLVASLGFRALSAGRASPYRSNQRPASWTWIGSGTSRTDSGLPGTARRAGVPRPRPPGPALPVARWRRPGRHPVGKLLPQKGGLSGATPADDREGLVRERRDVDLASGGGRDGRGFRVQNLPAQDLPDLSVLDKGQISRKLSALQGHPGSK